ncbi:MAG: X-Pro dipeptidyl-peptidase C-terminal domain [Naasia sp.]|jgi:predicted acyl esterase|uniref:CocE/NonD family hydrolase n=1 Tax=Naasia sp. TaxID=2546198 RepID=UPI0026120F02|nr:CocE/NonD family hydrolase [Naasia sp.]MCU1570138.1 X-Pro dipeptidyl-peptidase C-terminal domain [Naasia sp.]
MPESPYPLRPPRSTPESRRGVPPQPRTETRDDMIIERDVEVRTRSGRTVQADVYRPRDGDPVPPLIAWSPYGKHDPAPIGQIYPASGVKPEHMSDLTTFEGPDPVYWVPRGYAIVIADIPGTWYAKGPASYLSPEEAEDFYDLIEWAGVQDWSNGKVGLSGVSYLTVAQWRVAALHPPHLAAINPWEGWSDTYREVARHGGIPETSFWPYIWERWGASTGPIEDLELETREHPFFDEFWASKAADLEAITVPAFVVGSWSDQGLHTRGTLEGFRRISSPQKWLYVHGRKKWAEYYLPENVELQRDFFDRFLKDAANDVEAWPRVRAELRTGYYEGEFIESTGWPLPDIDYRELHLDASTGLLTADAPPQEATAEYHGLGDPFAAERLVFEHRFAEPTDIVGHSRAVLHMSAPKAADMDVFVGLFKRDGEGRIVPFPYYAQFEDGPVALGWLRASHRELDEERSTSFLPVLAHRRALPLEDDGPSRLDIEILPSGTRFAAGDSLVLVVQGYDIKHYRKPLVYARHESDINTGPQVLHTGGRHDSRLILPVRRR